MDDWDPDVIDGLAPHIDMHGIHLYTGSADISFSPHSFTVLEMQLD